MLKDVIKGRKLLVSVILIMVLSCYLSGCAVKPEGTAQPVIQLQPNQTIKYTMYIGLNDKDTYTQLISYEEAEQKVSAIVLKYVDGFTALSGKGAYKDDKGVITHENSLVLEFTSATEEQIKAIMDEVIKELNQNSVLMEKQAVNYEFYEGPNNDQN